MRPVGTLWSTVSCCSFKSVAEVKHFTSLLESGAGAALSQQLRLEYEAEKEAVLERVGVPWP